MDVVYYSKFYFFGEETPLSEEFFDEVLECYRSGTKIYGVFSTKEQIESLLSQLQYLLLELGLEMNSPETLGETQEEEILEEIVLKQGFFFCFHGSFHLVSSPFPSPISSFFLENGKLDKYAYQMEEINQHSSFDLPQFLAEHGELTEHLLVEGGAGCGKSRSFLPRLSYLWYRSDKSPEEFFSSVEIIFYSAVLRDNFRKKLKTYLESSWLLTRKICFVDLLASLDSLHTMTLEEFALQQLQEDLCPTEDVSLLEKLIADCVEGYFLEETQRATHLLRLGLSLAEVGAMVRTLLMALYGQQRQVSAVTASDFGGIDGNDPYGLVKDFLHNCLGSLGKQWEDALVAMGKIHRCQVFSYFLRQTVHSTGEQENKTFMIDDVDLLKESALQGLVAWINQKNRTLYMAQNRHTQLLPREKSDFLQQFSLVYGDNLWKFYSFSQNYRSDQQILNIFRENFSQHEHFHFALEAQVPLREYNHYLQGYPQKFFRRVEVYSEKQCFSVIYQEILRVKRRISYEKTQGMEEQESIAVILQNQQEVKRLTRYLQKHEMPVHVGPYLGEHLQESRVFSDMLLLIRALVYYDDPVALYELAESNFFALEIPKNRLYHLGHPENSEEALETVESYLSDCISKMFAHYVGTVGAFSWEDFQNTMMESSVLPYLKDFFALSKPWGKMSPVSEIQEEYCQNMDKLFLWLQEQGRHSLWEIYDILKAPCDVIAQTEDFASEYLAERGIFCLTMEESLGLEFAHVMLPILQEREPTVPVQCQGVGSQVGYCFTLEEKNLANQYYALDNGQEKTKYFYEGFHRARCSFLWIVEKR